MNEALPIAVLGAGTVGAATVALCDARPELHVRAVLVRDGQRPRPFRDWSRRVTTDASEALAGARVVVEAMGGTGEAATLMLRALESGARVVTANKAALAERWDLFAPYLAEGRLYPEAAVMAGTPVLGPLTGALRGSRPLVLHAILNGTCNVVLARMEQGVPFQQALAEAQRDGYAEADPSLDVDGIDAAHKLALLARLAVDPELDWAEVREATRGIRGVTPAHLAAAAEAGARVRLVGTLEAGAGAWRACVRPVRLPLGHPLLSARHVHNALWLRSAPLGEVLIVGPGAGGGATASAVLADVLQAAAGRPGPAPLATAVPLPEEGAQEDELGGLEPLLGVEAA